MKEDNLVLSYIDKIPFKQKGFLDTVEKTLVKSRLTVESVRVGNKIEDWKTIRIYQSGKREVAPFCLKSTLENGQLRLILNKKALPDLGMSLSLARKQNKPFKSKYEAILAHWLYRVGIPFEVDKSLFRAVLGVTSGYKETDIKRKILNPSVTELNTLFPGLHWSAAKDSYHFTKWIKTERVETDSDEYPPADQILAAMLGEEMEGIKKSKIDELVLALEKHRLIPDQALSQRAYEKLKNKTFIGSWPALLMTMINAGDFD